MIKTVYFSFCLQKPKLFLFAGQGTQRKGMLSDLLKIPSARK
jgi:malonyl CoA-acyl carrier protein transacylase